MLNRNDASAGGKDTVIIKKYANRRLYNTETSTYVTLEDLATMVRADRDFTVYDAKSGDDLTHTVLTQIIVDQESKGGKMLLPTPFLRQLIRFYDDSISRMVPGYLQFSLETLAQEQEKFRSQFSNSFGNPTAAFEAYQVQARRNMEIFEKAMSLWTPFTPGVDDEAGTADAGKSDNGDGTAKTAEKAPRPKPASSGNVELDELKSQLTAMQDKIEKLSGTGRV